MERLQCHVKEYAWGKHGADSEVARLFAAGHTSFSIGKSTPYAELWMGTHPDGPARLAGSNATRLSAHIAQSGDAVGYLSNNNGNEKREDVHLPFIMKVMSIRTTLSLQVHPTKEQAVRLHARDPLHYPDEHHKPELAYALTRFELLCGFRPAKQLLANIEAFAPLRTLFGEQNCTMLRNLIASGFEQTSLKCRIALAAMFRTMMDVEAEQLPKLLYALFTLLDQGVRGALTEGTVGVIRKMAVDFPGDVGIFSPLYLNHMILEPGECCYYAAEELHAYLSGECVECVGCSNNTIRAALTSKFIDRPALCEVLNYMMTDPSDYLVPAVRLAAHPHVTEYAPDCKDFQLHRVSVPSSPYSSASLPPLACASIMVIVAGAALLAETDARGEVLSRKPVRRGDILYLTSGRRVAVVECSEPLEAYRTFSFEVGPDHGKKRSQKHGTQLITPLPLMLQKKLDMSVFNVAAEMDGMV